MPLFERMENFKPSKGTIVTIGTFDGVHLGHQKIIQRLNELKTETGLPTVVLTFDPHPRKILFPEQQDLKLITTTEEKCQLLNQYGVDHVIVYPFSKSFSEMQASEYIEKFIVNSLRTSILVIGYDHRFGANREGNIDILQRLSSKFNYNVEEIPVQDINQLNVSSTRIRKAIEEGDIETATQFLGHSFLLTGAVVKGKQLGRTIGYPTANIITDTDKIIPKIGVYAVRVKINELVYGGMLNIGYNPTTDQDHTIKIEVHIFDFNQDIYDQTIQIEFIKRTRDELKFEGLPQLIDALKKDEIECQSILKALK